MLEPGAGSCPRWPLTVCLMGNPDPAKVRSPKAAPPLALERQAMPCQREMASRSAATHVPCFLHVSWVSRPWYCHWRCCRAVDGSPSGVQDPLHRPRSVCPASQVHHLRVGARAIGCGHRRSHSGSRTASRAGVIRRFRPMATDVWVLQASGMWPECSWSLDRRIQTHQESVYARLAALLAQSKGFPQVGCDRPSRRIFAGQRGFFDIQDCQQRRHNALSTATHQPPDFPPQTTPQTI